MIGGEGDLTTNKRTWFDTQVCATLLWSCMILLTLTDYTDMRRIIGRILDDVLAPHVSMNDSIAFMTSYFHVSMMAYSGSINHLQLHNVIYGNMLSLS